ncbi:penicillin-binding protein 1C [Phaeodactylibacter luteus]|uniref:peptidoglycan glycosyltransferase n=1 Tax=Phaeodactylibacter luteus TaxID=1564516 RepID=A0A5C6RKP4_9BACT|nr:penicillin-binding protein 1C [Phaeodactylibacter luteus]TXB62180.1 penicillin-binding protein 1C [Phaeodactylibacter luteus]
MKGRAVSWLRGHPRTVLFFFAVLLGWYAFSLPRPLFRPPYSLVLESQTGTLLGARIAKDGQWRFPVPEELPPSFTAALVEFEDRRFYRHPGIDPIGLGRALWQNLKAGRVVSGGSTLSMQVIRMSLGNPPRTVLRKIQELILATRLELSYSKQHILQLYAAHAPFGGNVVGLEAAAWRYFGKPPALLTWSESAMLAVLPNSPGLIHPGRNRAALAAKRDRLLERLCQAGYFSQADLQLFRQEPLPEAPRPLPQYAPHLLSRLQADGREGRITSTIDAVLQQQLTELAAHHQSVMRANQVHNLAVLVLDTETGETLAYIGNAPNAGQPHSEDVDIIPAPRSTGSILKPLLYAYSLQEGLILPSTLLLDIPTRLSGYQPENFHEDYDGAVSAERALARSLNVPMVRLLQDYGLEKFHLRLRQLGLGHIRYPARHYGLPLVLGGAEASLWELTGIYASMGRTLLHQYAHNGWYTPSDFRPAVFEPAPLPERPLQQEPAPMSAGAAWLAFEAMQHLERPGAEGQWEAFSSSRKIAWKTGTSFGFRDAWAIGASPRYTVGVWVGNADGEGRPGLVGVRAAAPLLFEVFNRLPAAEGWFPPPWDALHPVQACRQSGYAPSPHCPVDTAWAAAPLLKTGACPYHQVLHLERDSRLRAHAGCAPASMLIPEPWFLLPPAAAYFYQKRNPAYAPPPTWAPGCKDGQDDNMALIYPQHPARVKVPVDLDGQPSKVIFSAAHRFPGQTVYWHLDETYLGATTTFHSMELSPSPGHHLLTLVDEGGQTLQQPFFVLE